ncbi:MAG: glycosyltransferase family 2 protein [Candidatus Aminicenantes bacterium]|nr:glycosyltransferase family 2 protein [Candidatus Aminicenantes bacterium]
MISVIIPTYNRAHFLREAIESVLSQSAFRSGKYDFELIVIDDGSTDGTRELVEELRGPLRYVYQSHQGVSRARNLGLELAKGEFIAFLDSDDLWLPDKIKHQMNVMETFPQLMGCMTEEIWVRRGCRVNPKKKHKKYSGWIFPYALPLCLLSLSACLFRRQVFKEVGLFDENLPVCEDYDFCLRYSLRFPLHLIERPLIIKRGGHKDQLSRQFWGMDRYRIQALMKLLQLDLSPDQANLVRWEIWRKAKILQNGYLKRGNQEEASYFQNLISKMAEELQSGLK